MVQLCIYVIKHDNLFIIHERMFNVILSLYGVVKKNNNLNLIFFF